MTKRERTFDLMAKNLLRPAPAFKRVMKPAATAKTAAPLPTPDAEEERMFERDLEQLLMTISAFTACAPEATAQTDERIRNMMLSLVSGHSYAKDKSKLDAQQVANRKKPAAEERIRTRKPRCGSEKKSAHGLKHDWGFKARRPATTKFMQTPAGLVPVTFLTGAAYGPDGRPLAAGYRCPAPQPPCLQM